MEVRFLSPSQAYVKLQGLNINKGCTKLHFDNIISFNTRQKTRLLHGMNKLEKLLERYFVDVGKIEFVLLDSGVYWDFPFTYGKTVICMTPKLFQKNQEHLLKILTHEWVHLDQRRSPDKYERYYNTLGFTRTDMDYGALEPHLLRNPDGDQYEWIWEYGGKIYAPIALLMQCNFHVLLLEITQPEQAKYGDDTKVIMHKVHEIVPYYERFGTKKQLYHPNEISAHLLADYIVMNKQYVQIDYDHLKRLLG